MHKIYKIHRIYTKYAEVGFRAGQISKILKIGALGSKCDPSLQDGLPGALGTDSGPILGPFWLPKSDQIGPKRAPKSIKKVIEKLVEFGIDF